MADLLPVRPFFFARLIRETRARAGTIAPLDRGFASLNENESGGPNLEVKTIPQKRELPIARPFHSNFKAGPLSFVSFFAEGWGNEQARTKPRRAFVTF